MEDIKNENIVKHVGLILSAIIRRIREKQLDKEQKNALIRTVQSNALKKQI